MTISSSSLSTSIRCSWTLAGIAMQPLDVYRARPLKPVLKFKLHRVTYPELVHPVFACLGPLKATSFPSSAKMQPESSFRETRVIEPRIGQVLLQGETELAMNIRALRLNCWHSISEVWQL